MKELISVIIPVYNGEAFLKDAIISIQQQTYSHLEIIVIDDGSTDHSAEICQQLAVSDARIQLIQADHKGSAAARNAGIRHATGEIIALLDADDIAEPDRLKIQKEHLDNHPEIAAVSCLAYYINEAGTKIGHNYSDLLTTEDSKKYLEQNKILFCLQTGFVIRKSVLVAMDGYNEDVIYAQDIDLFNRMADEGYFFVVIPQYLVRYRIHNQSSMTRIRDRINYADWVTRNILRRRKGKPELTLDEFLSKLKEKSVIFKLKRWRHYYGSHIYRTAGLCYGYKKYISFAFYLFLAFLIRPLYTWHKLRLQVFKKQKPINS